MRVTCTYHCSACGKHFHSLESFDCHREGDYGSSDPELGRHCAHPWDLDGRLVELTQAGICRAYEAAKAPVTVWTTRPGRARGAFSDWPKPAKPLAKVEAAEPTYEREAA